MPFSSRTAQHWLPLAAASLVLCARGSSANTIDGSCIGESFLNEPPSKEVSGVVSRGQRDFSVNLIKSMFDDATDEGQNIFVSPSSIYQSLMLAYFGADGVTEKELEKVMGLESLEKDDVKKSYVYERAFQAVREKKPDLGYKLVHANRLFFERSLPLNGCIRLLLNREVGAVDFVGNAEKARREINRWVEEKTLKKIKDLLPEGSVDASTQIALTNAAYFKGQWKSQFKPTDTKMDNFYVKRDKIKVAKFMKQQGQFNYYTSEELGAHVVQMPYVGDSISMLIVLPPFADGALRETVKRMTPEVIQGVVAEMKSGFYKADDLNVKIPKFNVEQSMDLAATLGGLGVPSLFQTAATNLTGFLSRHAAAADRKISLQSALHKSYIEVNEEGSEAAAATALFGFRSARPLFDKDFVANHPFIFLIYDVETDIILFFGVLQDPTVAF